MSSQATPAIGLRRKIRDDLRPWYKRNRFLAAVFLFLVLAVVIAPQNDAEGYQWVFVVASFLVALTWAGIVITDVQRPTWMGIVAAVGLLVFSGWLFLRYSGAEWDLLGFVFFNFELLRPEDWLMLLSGLKYTLMLAVASIVVSTLIGLFLAILRTLDNRVFNFFIVAYIDIFRAIPTIVLAIVIYYALPPLGIVLPQFLAGVMTLSINSSAYTSEIFRSGLLSIDKGQIEAAHALGLNTSKTMRLVILPQAIRVVIPPLTGQWIAVLKDTAILSAIGIGEMLREAQASQAFIGNPTPLMVATIIYLIMLLPLTRLSSTLEVRMRRGRR